MSNIILNGDELEGFRAANEESQHMVLKVDARTNDFEILMSEQFSYEEIVNHKADECNYEQFNEGFIAFDVSPLFRAPVREFLKVETVQSSLSDKNSAHMEFENCHGCYSVLSAFAGERDAEGKVVSFYVSSQDSFKDVEDYRVDRIKDSLKTVYSSLYLIDLVTDECFEVFSKDYVQLHMKSYGEPAQYHNHIQEFVKPKWIPIVKEFADLSTIVDRLRDKDIITVEYESVRQGWRRQYAIAMNRNPETGDVESLLYATQAIDEEKKKELEYQKQLEQSYEDEKKAKSELEIALGEARQADQSKNTFIRKISHDIRTPLNGIMGMLEIAKNNEADSAVIRECLEQITDCAEKLHSLFDDILDLKNLESEELEITYNAFEMKALIDDTVSTAKAMAKDRDVSLKVNGLDAVKHNYLVGGEEHLKQLIGNLLANAIKYNKPQGEVVLDIVEKETADTIVSFDISISDTGVGMSDELLAHAFDPFVQGEVDKTSGEAGAGLGLSIAKKIVDGLGGEISMDSEEGIGTKVSLTLPFVIDANPIVDKTDDLLRGTTILNVDDNEINRRIIETILEDTGITVFSAENGLQAVDVYMNNPEGTFDFILMDIMMPVMDGYDATKAIRSSGRKDAATIPIVALTANAFDSDIKKSLANGMNGHIAKPVKKDDLIGKIISIRNNGI